MAIDLIRHTDAIHLKNLENILDKPILGRFVISNDLSRRALGDGIISIPAAQFLS